MTQRKYFTLVEVLPKSQVMKWIRRISILVAVLAFMLFVGAEEAHALKFKGAAKRRARSNPPWSYDIDDLIRAEDDPNFTEFVKERAKAQEIDQKEADRMKAERAAFEAQAEKQRIEFVKEREKKKVRDEMEGYEEFREAQYRFWERQEKEREAFQRQREVAEAKLRSERRDRLVKAFPKDLLPPDIDEPKYPKESNLRLPASTKKSSTQGQ